MTLITPLEESGWCCEYDAGIMNNSYILFQNKLRCCRFGQRMAVGLDLHERGANAVVQPRGFEILLLRSRWWHHSKISI